MQRRPRGRERADARGSRLLPDRDVQEPRELARAKAILDLLLEPADQEHLAEEAAQDFLGDAAPPGLGPLFDGRHRAAIMLIRRCGLPTSGCRSRRGSTPGGRGAGVVHAEASVEDAAAVLGPCSPDESATSFGSTSGAPRRCRAGAEHSPAPRQQANLGDARADRHHRRRRSPRTGEPTVAPASSLATAWDTALSEASSGWSDVLCELELDSSDHLPRAALLGARSTRPA